MKKMEDTESEEVQETNRRQGGHGENESTTEEQTERPRETQTPMASSNSGRRSNFSLPQKSLSKTGVWCVNCMKRWHS